MSQAYTLDTGDCHDSVHLVIYSRLASIQDSQEILESFKEMFPLYYMYSDICLTGLKFLPHNSLLSVSKC